MSNCVSSIVGSFFNVETLFIPLLKVSMLIGITALFVLGLRLIRYFIRDMKNRKLGGDKLEVWKNGKRIY